MKLSRHLTLWSAAVALSVFGSASFAKVSPDEAAHLGQDLTPVGAEKAGNKDGTIPEWAPTTQKGPLSGEYPSEPKIDAEKPLFTITKANMAQYADKLTEGHKVLLERYPDSYKMNVYPSHRIVTFPKEVLDATKENATNCELIGTDVVNHCKLGFPFPIPKSGAEPIWNHKLKWRGEAVTRYNNQMIVQPDGHFQLTKLTEDVIFEYASIQHPKELVQGGDTEFLRYLSHTVAPPRLAGTYILAHEKMSTGPEGRAAWLYSPGLRRIRRAPTVAYDNPYEGTDGQEFYDQVDMFNGALDRYNWKLLGKKEMYIPYDSDKIGGPSVKFADLAKPHHLNQDLPRYELHRVWVVEANLKPDTHHTFKRRVYYIDEDGWNIVAEDDYDNRDQLFQFHEGHYVFARNVLTGTTIPEVIYHFDSGRYFITAMANEDKPNDLSVHFSENYFTAQAVQKSTTR